MSRHPDDRPLARARWWMAYLRLRGDRYLTQHYGAARIAIACLVLVVTAPLVTRERAPDAPVLMFADWIVYIIILVVAAILAVALAPKPVTPEAQKGQVPQAEDGKAILEVYGEVWIDDAMVLGFQTMGADPIKKKGGKK